MLLPDNVHPEQSLYYNGALILCELDKLPKQKIMDLYARIKAVNGMSFFVFVLCLDWLYLIRAAQLSEKGIVEKCS